MADIIIDLPAHAVDKNTVPYVIGSENLASTDTSTELLLDSSSQPLGIGYYAQTTVASPTENIYLPATPAGYALSHAAYVVIAYADASETLVNPADWSPDEPNPTQAPFLMIESSRTSTDGHTLDPIPVGAYAGETVHPADHDLAFIVAGTPANRLWLQSYGTIPIHVAYAAVRLTYTELPPPPPPILVSPDFFFSDYVLDPEKPHRIEITFDPTSPHDGGGRQFWLTGVRDHQEAADFAAIDDTPGFANLYDGSGNTLDHASIVIGPGAGGWNDPATGVAAGYNRLWFRTDAFGAVSEVAVTKICTTPPPPPPPPPPAVKPPPEPTHPEVAKKPSAAPAPAWAADVRISMPMPPNRKPQVNVGGGFAFTSAGLIHDISEAVYKQLATPTFAPTEYGQEVVYDDEDIDAPPTDLKVF